MPEIVNRLRAITPCSLKQAIPVPVKRSLLYLLRFGLFKGLSTLLTLYLSKDEIIILSVPQSSTPIYLRPNTSDRQIFGEVFIDQDYEIPVVFSPKLIVDCGANVGYASVFFANRYPGARIIAVEPEGANIAMLEKNTALYPRINIIKAGIWYKPGFLKIENPQAKSASFRLSETRVQTDRSIPAITMDDLFQIAGVPFIDILKLDIEGAEKELLSHGESWLNKIGVLIVELHDRFVPGCTAAFQAATANFDFKHFKRGTNNILVSPVYT